MPVGDLPEPRVFPSIAQAWRNMWPSFWWLLLFGLISALATEVLTAPSRFPIGWQLQFAFGTVGITASFFLGGPLGIGLFKAHLAASRGQKPTWTDFGYGFTRYWQTVLLALLSFLIVIGGLILLIIPGIYFAVKLSFAGMRFIEDNLDAVDAIKASFADVKGRWWSVFGLGLMSAVLFFAGVLALGIGVFVALVLVSQMPVVYWRAIEQRA